MFEEFMDMREKVEVCGEAAASFTDTHVTENDIEAAHVGDLFVSANISAIFTVAVPRRRMSDVC